MTSLTLLSWVPTIPRFSFIYFNRFNYIETYSSDMWQHTKSTKRKRSWNQNRWHADCKPRNESNKKKTQTSTQSSACRQCSVRPLSYWQHFLSTSTSTHYSFPFMMATLLQVSTSPCSSFRVPLKPCLYYCCSRTRSESSGTYLINFESWITMEVSWFGLYCCYWDWDWDWD